MLAKFSSQGFKRTHQGLRVLMLFLLHILWLRSLLHVIWPDQDPYCMSSGLTGIVFFFLYYYYYYYFYYYFFFFSSFWDFGPSWSFLTSWIGHSFVKTHGLSLLFMEWHFLWNFGPQQGLSVRVLWRIVKTMKIAIGSQVDDPRKATWEAHIRSWKDLCQTSFRESLCNH